MKPLIPAIALTVLLLAGCGPAAHHKAARQHASGPGPLTAAQAGAICEDVALWLPKAENEGTPRFTAKLRADAELARATGSQLGTDLAGLDSDLLSENAVALSDGPPGDLQNIQLVRSDCRAFGVTVPGA